MSRIRNKKKVLVAMSGGVDSSVAALLLSARGGKKQGCDVTGVFIRCWNVDGCAERDAEDARRVAAYLNIPFYVFDFENEYKKRVVDYMIDGYRKGITPNPDVMCNKEIKFGLFLKKALELGADYVATGHYVRKGEASLQFSLYQAKDKNKDQSYFLWTLTQDQLKHCLFPIGNYLKSEVRAMARQAGLGVAEKKDSQGICFLGKVTLVDFLKNYISEKKGEVCTTSGKKLGDHRGVWFYTIGQRHIGIASHSPVYVTNKDIETNILFVAEGENNSALYRKEVELTDVNFINPKLSSLISAKGGQARLPASGGNKGIEVLARLRYRQPLAEAKVYQQESARQSASISVVFEKSQKFVAPGQSAVFYSKNGEMLGGGIIK